MLAQNDVGPIRRITEVPRDVQDKMNRSGTALVP